MKKTIIMVAVAVTFFSVLSGAAIAVTLPDPTIQYTFNYGQPPATITRYVAWAHDDFWSYSAAFLEAAQAYGSISGAYGDYAAAFGGVGTGTLDVLLYTGASGQTNLGVGPGGAFNFENPVYDAGGSNTNFEGWWGQNDQKNDGTITNVNGPVTVGQVLDYLHAFDPNNNIPVFGLDLNQTGNQPNLGFVGNLALVDPLGINPSIIFAFDQTAQGGGYSGTLRNCPGGIDCDWPGFNAIGAYDQNSPATAIYFGGGGGNLDYVAYAPMMNLANYPRDYLFVADFRLGDFYGMPALNNGPEEIYLLGGLSAPQVPEPTTILLLGLGLLGLAGVRRTFQK